MARRFGGSLVLEPVALDQHCFGAVSIAACFVTIAVIDKVGRKPLLIGSAGMA
jgi:hypothetical protein